MTPARSLLDVRCVRKAESARQRRDCLVLRDSLSVERRGLLVREGGRQWQQPCSLTGLPSVRVLLAVALPVPLFSLSSGDAIFQFVFLLVPPSWPALYAVTTSLTEQLNPRVTKPRVDPTARLQFRWSFLILCLPYLGVTI